MTSLQPWVLVALPLVALPLIIHLINQRRFQTVPWAAMRFLLAARAMSSGYSKLRHWLIMLLRMLAVAAVILAIGRPLSRGWLALAGGARPDTAIVVLDRSPSMQARDPAAPETKLATGRRQLAETLATLAPQRCLLVEGDKLVEVPPAALEDLSAAGPVAAQADIPGMLQATYDHIRDNAAGTAEVWICSDGRMNDWGIDDGGWAGLRDAFAKLPQQVRFQLVSFDSPPAGNVAVRVTEARLERRGEARELLVSVVATRQDSGDPVTLPLKFEIGGVMTTVDVELSGREAVLANHALPLGRGDSARGFGRVSIPADTCEADNDFYFVFDDPPPRLALVVAEEAAAGRVLELAASIPPSKELAARAESVPRAGLATAPWSEAAALIWQGQLPEADEAQLVDDFIARGGQVIFFPPEDAQGTTFAGVSWGEWLAHPQALKPEQWRSDEDILANTLASGALPVGELEVRRSCGLGGEIVPLATLADGLSLVARLPDGRGVYFCATLPRPRDSSLASEGIVLYALLQRLIERGLEPLAGARQIEAGPAASALLAAGEPDARWERLAGPAGGAGAEAAGQAGVYSSAGRLVAINRPAAEDLAPIASPERIDGLFRGLSYTRVEGRAGRADSIVQEIWRAFLIAMLLALVGEGLLSLPRRRPAPQATPSLTEAAA
ncbi:MAG: BatA domain-containing protein [Planctomycetota bacterium]